MSVAPAPLEFPVSGTAEPGVSVNDAAAFAAATGAGPAAMADMAAFMDALDQANGRMNLVGPSAMSQFWPRHAWDGAQLLIHAPDARTWADLGAGAGLPGVVLAILLKAEPGAHVHLVESLAKRCGFLREVVEALDLPATVHNARAESLSLKVDVVTARACAPMAKLLGFAKPFLAKGATGLFLKGREVEVELTEAARYWRFQAELIPSLSSPSGRVVKVKGLSRVA